MAMRKRSKNKIILRQSSHCEETGLFMRALRAKSCLAFVLFLSALIGQAQGNVASPNTAGLESLAAKDDASRVFSAGVLPERVVVSCVEPVARCTCVICCVVLV